MPNELAIKKRIENLRATIKDLRYRYHVENDPNVTDEVYDSLSRELRALEKKYPLYQEKVSSLDRVAGMPLDKFVKVHHSVPMLSLNDVFSKEELSDWEERVKKNLVDNKINYFCELKFDGLAVSLIYEKGKLARGATRGDGQVGENITENLKMIKSIPLELPSPYPLLVEVRGEAIMSKATWQKLNEINEKKGLPLFANTRNAAAGSLRQLDPNIAKERKLDFFAYDLAEIKGANFETRIKNHSDKHNLMREFGFIVSNHERECQNLKEVCDFIDEIEKLRPDFAYGTDGVVISVNNLEQQKSLGFVGKAPRFMVAYKYPAEKATTIVKNIIVNVGRTGALTPVALFNPTKVAGSVISKATLHNLDQIERLGLRIGDTVVIQKAGDVIPEVVEVLTKMRTGKEKKFMMSKVCPICGGKIEKKKIGEKATDSTAYYCVNKNCGARNQRQMEHFVNAFEIYTIGPKILARLKDEGLISDASDLFTLKKEDLAGLERFGEKSAENIINSIEAHRKISLDRFIYALGIIHIGEQTARDLASYFGSLDKIIKAKLEDLNNMENIGPIVGKSLFDYFGQKENRDFIEKLKRNGVVVADFKQKTGDLKLKGLNFVITGTMAMSREEIKKNIFALGGKVLGAISANTDYLIAGKNPGSKLAEAGKLGVKVIGEKELIKLLK